MKKNELSGSELIKKINDFIARWDDFQNKEIERVLTQRTYINNTATEEANINLKGSLAKAERVTLSQLRPAINKVKTDTRNSQPTINAIPAAPISQPYVQKTFAAIAEKFTLTSGNMSELYKFSDNLLDLSFAVLRIVDDVKFNSQTKSINKSIIVENVDDIYNIALDAKKPLSKMSDGDAIAYRSKFTDDKNVSKNQIEYWEKVYKTKKYGERFDGASNKLIAEEIDSNKKYLFEHEIEEVDYIIYVHIVDNEIKKYEAWPYTVFPYLSHFAVAFETGCANDEKRSLILTPFPDHVINAQKTVNYAATQQLYNLKSARSTTKAMYPKGMITGEDIEKWNNRNITEEDLEYNIIQSIDGTPMPMKPDFINSAAPAPAVTEVVANYPKLVNALIGVNLDGDINYNVSGETIKQMKALRSENSRLYRDEFVSFLQDKLGKALAYYIPAVYTRPQYITIDNYGEPVVVMINGTEAGSINIKDMINKFEISMSVSANKTDQKNKTYSSLKDLYAALGQTQSTEQVILNTLDIFADAMDCQDSDEISARLKPMVPQSALDITAGKLTVAQSLSQIQQQQQQQQQMQQQQQQQQTQIETMKEQANMLDAQAKLLAAQNSLKKEQIRANAEVAKNV